MKSIPFEMKGMLFCLWFYDDYKWYNLYQNCNFFVVVFLGIRWYNVD